MRSVGARGSMSQVRDSRQGKRQYLALATNVEFELPALASLEAALNDPSKMVKCPFCPKTFATLSHLEDHKVICRGRKINPSNSKKPSVSRSSKKPSGFRSSKNPLVSSLVFIVDFFYILFMGILDSAGRHNNAGQIPHSNSSFSSTYRCINGHQITSVTIPTKCPFCGRPMTYQE